MHAQQKKPLRAVRQPSPLQQHCITCYMLCGQKLFKPTELHYSQRHQIHKAGLLENVYKTMNPEQHSD